MERMNMAYPERALQVWLGRGQKNDVQRLQSWRDAPLTYFPEQELDPNWVVDRYETVLGQDSTGDLFQKAARLTLQNRFYPPEVMTTVSDYSLENRPIRVGDRVLQRIRVFQYKNFPLLEVLTLNEITEVVQEPRRVGFTYTTTAAHSEIGEWSPEVIWRENGEVVLVINVLSRSRPGASRLARQLTRRLQLHAHQLSIQNFLALLHGRPRSAEPYRYATLSASLLPVALLAAAFILLLLAMFHFKKKEII